MGARVRGLRPAQAVALGVAGILVLVPPLSTGCGGQSDASQAQVIVTSSSVPTPSEEATRTLTPLERGKVRREALAVAEAGLAAWLADDLAAMEEYFTEDNVDYFRGLHDQYAAEGKVRVREHSATALDITGLSEDGTEATADYYLTDDSYFADAQGRALTEPTHADATFSFTLVRTDEGGWIITRFFGAREHLQ
jgi:hypothetical protein